MKIKLIPLLVLSLLTTQAFAQDWPQWRGANQDNKSTEDNLLQSWPDDGPKQLWVSDQGGLGYAGFSIVDGKMYTMGLDGDSEFAICLDANSGDEVWKTELANRYNKPLG